MCYFTNSIANKHKKQEKTTILGKKNPNLPRNRKHPRVEQKTRQKTDNGNKKLESTLLLSIFAQI